MAFASSPSAEDSALVAELWDAFVHDLQDPQESVFVPILQKLIRLPSTAEFTPLCVARGFIGPQAEYSPSAEQCGGDRAGGEPLAARQGILSRNGPEFRSAAAVSQQSTG